MTFLSSGAISTSDAKTALRSTPADKAVSYSGNLKGLLFIIETFNIVGFFIKLQKA